MPVLNLQEQYDSIKKSFIVRCMASFPVRPQSQKMCLYVVELKQKVFNFLCCY